MEETKGFKTLCDEVEKISQIEKCRTCQCFYDMLVEFREVLTKEKTNGEVAARLQEIVRKSEVTHDCLGCDPCYPVPVSNALHEISGMAAKSTCGPVCKPATAIERNLVSRLDHAAYLGRELEKANLSMCHGFQYIQDSHRAKNSLTEQTTLKFPLSRSPLPSLYLQA